MRHSGRRLTIALLLGACLAILPVTSAPLSQAVDYSRYVWEHAWVTQTSSPSAGEQAVRDELESEIQKVVDFCCTGRAVPRHLGPLYVVPGYQREDLYWLNPGETVLVLAESLEFLPETLRAEVIRYLKFEMQSPVYSPVSYSVQPSVPSPLLARDSFRSFSASLPDELALGFVDRSVTPRPENLYAVWAFAHHVSRFESPMSTPSAWQIVQDNWPGIESLVNEIPSTPATYWQIMGAIGYARMAKHLGKPYAQAVQRALNGLAAGVDYARFYRNMGGEVGCFGNDGNLGGWQGVWDYCAFSAVEPGAVSLYDTQFNHNGYSGEVLVNRPSMFAGEIGRFLQENVQSGVLSHINRYMDPSGQSYFPFWWESKGTKPWGVRDDNTAPPGNGENAIMHPSFAWQMFMLRANVVPGETGDTMRRFLDTPWAIGDVFHIQKLIYLLRLYSTVRWTETTIDVQKSASRSEAREGETIDFVVSFPGVGKPITVTDPLPVQLGYVSAESTCAGTLDTSSNTVVYSGTPSANVMCNIKIVTRVNTDRSIAVTNTASIDDGIMEPRTASRIVILNGSSNYLPLLLRGLVAMSVLTELARHLWFLRG